MSKSVTVTLGGTDYVVPQLNIGQLTRVTDLISIGGPRFAFGVIGIALERAEPKVLKIDNLEVTMEEIGAAVSPILELSGLQKASPPGEAEPAAGP